MSETKTHTPSTRRIGSSDYGHVQGVCSCGWTGVWHSRRTVEGYRLAERDATEHAQARDADRAQMAADLIALMASPV